MTRPARAVHLPGVRVPSVGWCDLYPSLQAHHGEPGRARDDLVSEAAAHAAEFRRGLSGAADSAGPSGAPGSEGPERCRRVGGTADSAEYAGMQ